MRGTREPDMAGVEHSAADCEPGSMKVGRWGTAGSGFSTVRMIGRAKKREMSSPGSGVDLFVRVFGIFYSFVTQDYHNVGPRTRNRFYFFKSYNAHIFHL